MSNIQKSITPNPPANFEPTQNTYIPLKPFRFWCQKVLPLVYDDSLSYYELLCKVVDFLNKTMEDTSLMQEDVTNMFSAYNQLQSYVNNYFSTLDVQEEIDNKLDEMAEDGTLGDVLAPLINNSAVPVFVTNTSMMTDKDRIYVLRSTGHVWAWSETAQAFQDTSIEYGINDNAMMGYGSLFYSDATTPDDYKDANNLPFNRIYYYSGVTLANAPISNFSGVIATFSHSSDTTSGSQIAISQTHIFYYRHKSSGTWTNWIKNFSEWGTLFNGDNTPSGYKNFNGLPKNGIFWYANSSGLINAPYATFNGCVVTFTFTNTSTMQMQLAVDENANMWFRIYVTAWSVWNCVPSSNGVLYYSDTQIPEQYKDFNNIPPNKIFWYSDITTVNAPTSEFDGCVITYSYLSSSPNMVQIAVGRSGFLYYRMYVASAWGSWNRCLVQSDLPDSATVFRVGYTGQQNNYTSVVDALYEIAKTSGNKILYINEGTYDVLQELGGMDYIKNVDTSSSWDEVQPVVENTTIIGEGKVTLNFNLTTDTDQAHWFLFSCLNVRGNVSIQNIVINAQNCRYCIHDENKHDYPNTLHEYINVRCNMSGSYGLQCLGTGYSERSKIVLTDCVLNAAFREAYSSHGYEGEDFIFTNCVFIGGDGTNHHSVRLSQINTAYMQAKFNNCYFNNNLNLRDETPTTQSNDSTNVILINSKISSVINGYLGTVMEPVVSYNTIEQTVETLLPTTN